MREAEACVFPIAESKNALIAISNEIDGLERYPIDILPWSQYPYVPKASFSISYNNDSILLKYFVEEHSPKAIYWNTNDPVYKDSCVAFFVSFNEGKSYYNFEFNCVGVCMAGYGSGKLGRVALSPELISHLQVRAIIDQMSPNEKNTMAWQLTVTIPYNVFSYSDIGTMQERNCRCNFYKYGHEVDQPHFLCWNKIESAEPDFHLPQFFGLVNFE